MWDDVSAQANPGDVTGACEPEGTSDLVQSEAIGEDVVGDGKDAILHSSEIGYRKRVSQQSGCEVFP